MREKLLDYLLGELSPEERQEVERQLAVDSRWRLELERLREELRLLDIAREEHEPAGDLAIRTVNEVTWFAAAQHRYQQLELGGDCQAFRSVDLFLGTACCLLLAMMLFPAVVNSRDVAQRYYCQDNLRRLGMAMHAYADYHGTAPLIPPTERLCFAGVVAVALFEAGFISDKNLLRCPSADPGWPTMRIPTIAELTNCGPVDLPFLQRMAGGSYAFPLGIKEGNRLIPIRPEGRRWFAWVADAPDALLLKIARHGRGFNVFFEDGRVQWVTKHYVSATHDDLFRNMRGVVAAGVHKQDCVLGRSEIKP